LNFNKHKQCKYGVQNKCRECIVLYNKQRYNNSKTETKERVKQYNLEHKKEKQEQNKKYYESNKEKLNNERKEYYKNNKERELEINKKYQQEHKEEILKQRKEHYERNKEELKEKSREYRKNNPHIVFNNHIKRRKLEETQGEGISKDQWIEMMEFFNWECAYSGIQLNKDNRSIDHIIPLNNNGENNIWNCVPMLMNYNSSKNDSDWLEWYVQQDFYNEERLNKIYKWIEYAKNKYNK
jgi:5-methylcytosine-specific restriction endonuclease McrA